MKKVVISFIVILFLFILVGSDLLGTNNQSSPDSDYSSQRILWLNITSVDGFENYIILDINKVNESRFEVTYKLNETLKSEIDTCNALSLSPKETCFDNVKKDYVDEISKTDFDISINNLANYPKEELTSNIKLSGRINLNNEGSFYVDVLNYDSKDLSKSIGERFKIGYNSITVETVESTNNVGWYSSLALDSNGIAYISHMDGTNAGLRLCNNSGGSWNCEEVESFGGDIRSCNFMCGQYSSVAIDSNDKPHITHLDDEGDNWTIRYCTDAGNNGWNLGDCEEIETTNPYGYYSSTIINSSDTVHVIHTGLLATEDLRHCENLAGGWSCETIESANAVGWDLSAEFDSNDMIHISHYDSTDDNLRYCNGTTGSWSCEIIESDNDVGWQTSLAIDSNDMIHITHFDNTNDNLRYCNGTYGSWSCEVVESDNSVGWVSSIVIDINDVPHITHYDNTNKKIRYCDKNDDEWICRELTGTSNTFSLVQPYFWGSRVLGMKEGRIVDSTSFSNLSHMSFYNNTDLMYVSYDYGYFYSNVSTPINESFSNSLTNTFVCNSTANSNVLKNTTLYVWNSTSIVNNTETNTISSNTNSTSLTITLPREDIYEWNCYTCNVYDDCLFDILNNTLTIDTTYPSLTIVYPPNNTNHSINTLNVNYSASDTNLDSCWYSNDTMTINTTLTSCENITTVTWAEGNHNVTIWVNDSANNVNSSMIFFAIDTTAPNLQVDEPQEGNNYANNNSIDLNFSVLDNTLVVDTCWYKVDLVSPPLNAIDNTTISSCANTTFALPGGDEQYTLTFWVNDTLNNINTTTVNFGIRTDSPSINLNYPTNDSWLDSGSNIYFNFTATDLDGLSTCQLYGNWSGTFSLNYTWVSPTNATMNYTQVNLTDGGYIWNVKCNDTLGNVDWASSNLTFNIDTIKPNITLDVINTVSGSQTFTFNSTSQDPNLDSCKYTIRNSTGGIDGTNENISFTCNTQTSATATAYGTFNLTVYAIDEASNENSSTQSFTLTTAGLTGGGGGTGVLQTPKIAIINPEGVKELNDLERTIIFSRLIEVCDIDSCLLSSQSKQELLERLSEDGVDLTLEELNVWIQSFRDNLFEEVKVSQRDADRFNLFIGVLREGQIFELEFPRFDRFALISQSNTFAFLSPTNRELKSIKVISGDMEISTELVSESSANVILQLEEFPPKFFSRSFSSSLEYISTEGDVIFQEVLIRAINLNFKNPFTLFLPIWIAFIIYLSVIISLIFLVRSKRIKIKNKTIRKLLRVK